MLEPHLFCSSADGFLDGFHVLAVVNRAALSIGVHESFRILVFLRLFRSGVVGSYASSDFWFLKKLHTVLGVLLLIYIPGRARRRVFCVPCYLHIYCF